MDLYHLCVVLHVLAVVLWIGHMVFWSIVVGPMAKRMDTPEDCEALRVASSRHGGLGWPALIVLIGTGTVILHLRGTFSADGFQRLASSPRGLAFGIKMALVTAMIAYQFFIGHRPAPKLIYANMLIAFVIVALSVLLLRHPYLQLQASG